VVADCGQIPVVRAPGDLIDPDLDHTLQPVGVEHILGDTLTDRQDGAPKDAGERPDLVAHRRINFEFTNRIFELSGQVPQPPRVIRPFSRIAGV